MNTTEKKIVGVFSLLPLLAWAAVLFYFLYINGDLTPNPSVQEHSSAVTNIINHFIPFTIILSFAELVTGMMVIYYVVHIARLKNIETLSKVGLIIFLVFLGPIAVLVTWFAEVRKEPENVAMYPDIT